MKGLDEIVRDNDREATKQIMDGMEKVKSVAHEVAPFDAFIHYSPFDALVIRAQGILGNEGIDVNYEPLADAIYQPWLSLAKQLKKGDTIELPDGTELTCSYKPGNK